MDRRGEGKPPVDVPGLEEFTLVRGRVIDFIDTIEDPELQAVTAAWLCRWTAGSVRTFEKRRNAAIRAWHRSHHLTYEAMRKKVGLSRGQVSNIINEADCDEP